VGHSEGEITASLLARLDLRLDGNTAGPHFPRTVIQRVPVWAVLLARNFDSLNEPALELLTSSAAQSGPFATHQTVRAAWRPSEEVRRECDPT